MKNNLLMRKIILYCSFVITGLVVIVGFLTATSYAQLAVAILLYPLLVYFAFKAFPRKVHIDSSKRPVTSTSQPPSIKSEAEIAGEAKKENLIGITDIDKRVFLKLIGAAGLTLFLFSIFNKKAEGLFFKNIPTTGASGSVFLQDTAGNKIDPARSQPTDGYTISEVDDNVITFYGFTNKDGSWFVIREDSDTGSFRYARGNSNFPGNWTNRENLKYDYYSDVF